MNGHGCVPLDIIASRKAEITGRVIDKNGETLISVPVSLVPADAIVWPFSFTNLQGRFSFSHVPPGRYLLVINRTDYERATGRRRIPTLPTLFYPGVSDAGAATVIILDKDDKPRDYDFRLPE